MNRQLKCPHGKALGFDNLLGVIVYVHRDENDEPCRLMNGFKVKAGKVFAEQVASGQDAERLQQVAMDCAGKGLSLETDLRARLTLRHVGGLDKVIEGLRKFTGVIEDTTKKLGEVLGQSGILKSVYEAASKSPPGVLITQDPMEDFKAMHAARGALWDALKAGSLTSCSVASSDGVKVKATALEPVDLMDDSNAPIRLERGDRIEVSLKLGVSDA